MRPIGTVLIVFGLAVGLYGFFMDTTVVSSDLGHVNNLGLMNDKQITLFIAGVLCIIGSIFLAAAHVSDSIQNTQTHQQPLYNRDVKPETTANAEQILLQKKYDKGEIPFEIYRSEWDRLRK